MLYPENTTTDKWAKFRDRVEVKMPGDCCVVCSNSKVKDPSISMHQLPSDAKKKQCWCETFDMPFDDVKVYHRVCSS